MYTSFYQVVSAGTAGGAASYYYGIVCVSGNQSGDNVRIILRNNREALMKKILYSENRLLIYQQRECCIKTNTDFFRYANLCYNFYSLKNTGAFFSGITRSLLNDEKWFSLL